jgi:coproporphyrinogen III oxidase
MESWENARFQAKSHGTEKSEDAAYGQDITPTILNGFGDKEIFHHTAKRLCHRAYRLRFFIK